MQLVAHLIGLTDEEVRSLRRIDTDARVNVKSQNGLTTLTAFGIYDDIISLLAVITKYKNFEVHML